MMKNFCKKTLFLILCLLGMFACSEEEFTEVIPILEIDGSDTLILNDKVMEQFIGVKSNQKWTVVVEEGGDWCEVEKNNVYSGFSLNVGKNTEMSERWASILVESATLSTTYRVCQLGLEPAIKTTPYHLRNLSFEPDSILLQIVTNLDSVVVSIPDSIDWLEVIGVEETHLFNIWFKTSLNTSVSSRSTVIKLQHENGSFEHKVDVSQKGRSNIFEIIDPENLKKDIKLKIVSGSASHFQSSGPVEQSFDGKLNTMYHSTWHSSYPDDTPPDDYFPITLEYNLDSGVSELDYLVYYPRESGSNGHFKTVKIEYNTRDDVEFKSMGTIDFKGSASPTKVDFAETVENPKTIRFTVYSGTGDGIGYATCAEMEFYRRLPMDASLAAVFADEIYSELNIDVTYEQIQAIDNEFFKNIARHLFLGTYPLESRVRTYEPYLDPWYIGTRYKINNHNRLDNATGISVRKGEKLVVFTEKVLNRQISLCVLDYTTDYNPVMYPLIAGSVNELKMTSDGLVYIAYYGADHNDLELASDVKVHIATGEVNGMFKMEEHTDADWDKILSGAKADYMDLQGEKSHWVIPIHKLKELVSSPTALLQMYDKMVRLEEDFLGLDKYNIPIKNRMMFKSKIDEDLYMYATSFRTAYHENTLKSILNVEKMNSGENVWGPAHEVGHMHQTRPGLKWIGLTEVTNNIYSLHVQTSLGETSRLEADGRYDKAYNLTFTSDTMHHSQIGSVNKDGVYKNDVFCMLVPFWQLNLYTKYVLGNDYYKEIHEWVRNTPNPNPTDSKDREGENLLNFVRQTCEILNLDLTDFFASWGFLRPVDREVNDYAKAWLRVSEEQIVTLKAEISQYPKPNVVFKYIRDTNVDMFKNPKPVVEGSVSHSGNTITTKNWKNVVAFELWEGEKLKKLSQQEVFDAPVGFNWTGAKLKAIAADGIATEYLF